MINSELFKRSAGKEWLYNIMPIDNMPSVMANGILSYNRVSRSRHRTIAMQSVQSRRDRKRVPSGMVLHDYASLYFNPRNPMMFRRQELFNEICVLVVNPEVLDFPGVVISDGNAASNVSQFYSPSEGLHHLDFTKIYDRYWVHEDNPYVNEEHRRIECAEVLVPHQIPYSYIAGAYVATVEVRRILMNIGFGNHITVNGDMFFHKGGESQ